jgi:hypothetical protein
MTRPRFRSSSSPARSPRARPRSAVSGSTGATRTPTSLLLALAGLAVACGGQADDRSIADQFKPGTGVVPGKGGSGGTGVGKGGTGGASGKGGGSGVGAAGGATPSSCGNLFCEPGETCGNCAIDCGTCSGGAGGGTGGTTPIDLCSHDSCSVGPALSDQCGKCEAVVCQNDPFCCEREWDSVCVSGAQELCAQNCGVVGGAGGAGGGTGGFAGSGGGVAGAGGGGGQTGGAGGGPTMFCGDQVCTPDETCASCAADCGPCGNTCSHEVCSAGPPLKDTCGKCAALVCSQDPFCCESFWDATCVSEANQCASCGGGTAGTGGAGGGPVESCQSCAIGNCGPAVSACFQDAQCQTCFGGGDTDPACLTNQRVKDLIVCACNGSCSSACSNECSVVGTGGTGGTGQGGAGGSAQGGSGGTGGFGATGGTGGATGGSAGAGGGVLAICNDGLCTGGETCGSCPTDCGDCTCSHGVCFTGGRLDASCGSCAQTVCSQDPFCCSTDWDDKCVARAQATCGPDACFPNDPTPTDPHDACPGGPVTTLKKGVDVLIQGDTRIDRNDYEPSCVAGGVPGNDAVYAVKASAAGTLVVTVSGSSDLDPILTIKKACQGAGPDCTNNGVGKGTTEAQKRMIGADETVFVVIDAASGSSGPFKLQLSLL